MLATLYDSPFDRKDWIFEIKWDGYRAIAELEGNNVKLYSRNGLSFAAKYPGIYDALCNMDMHMTLDGEIVALDDKGKPDFQLLQQYEPNGNVPLVYYVFDLLYADGKRLEEMPLLQRKAMLKQLLPANALVQYCDHIAGKGKTFFKQAVKLNLEGIIAKDSKSVYREGKRSQSWLKIKNLQTDEAVIAGFTQPRNSRKFFGALVLGMYNGDQLEYIGHTGTGFNDKTLKELHEKMQPLITRSNPFGKPIRVNAPVTWVKPLLVANIRFTEVTSSGARRHPVFTGLRVDKQPQDVQKQTVLKK